MMPGEVDHYARALLSWNCEFARIHAIRRADKFDAKGDVLSAADWRAIEERICALRARELVAKQWVE